MVEKPNDLLRELLLEKYEPIAIVGVGLRFPGGSGTLAEFDEFLRAGGVGTDAVPAERWDTEHYYQAGPASRGHTNAIGGGFLDGIDAFDAAFFNISPKEARYVDPQHRLALEASWEALEHAGIDPHGLRGVEGGVYFGVSCFDYTLEIGALPDEELDAYVGTGTAHSAVPGRLSYLLGWHGPSIAIDTACSSSIVALDAAVSGLRRRECAIALCGGVNAIHHPLNHIVFSQAGMLAPDGRCKTFDERADGYARSEGCGVLVLKRFSDAKRAGDQILALIRGTAVRQDGASGGLTVPNSAAQEAVMRAALRNSALAPADIQYVEAHGTGTSLGDPIEMRSIAGVFAEAHSAADPLVVGSLKTNLGHMEAAAGIGGVIKTLLQLRGERFFPHLHLETPSTHIPWSRYPITVPTEGAPWSAPVRRAVVNSFGFAGTLAAAVLEQAPPAVPQLARADATDAEVFVLSARNERSLRAQTERYREFLTMRQDVSVGDVAYTAAVGRAHFDHRLAGVVTDADSLCGLLERSAGEVVRGEPKVAMLFTGQGSQYAGMGRALYQRYPAFREHLDACDELFRPHLGRSIRALLLGEDNDPGAIDQTRFTQPALLALEYAAARMWLSWGVEPHVLIGHSIGEVVAAAVAGLLSLPDAVKLVAVRARLMQSVTAPGGMLSVHAPVERIRPHLQDCPDLAFAAVNAPGLCVLSGGSDSLRRVEQRLRANQIATRALTVSHAFHSPLMAEVAEEFGAAIADLEFHEPERTLVSNVTGRIAPFELMASPEYWVRHIGAPVEFAAGMRAIGERGPHLFLEVGPSTTLLGLGRRTLPEADHHWLGTMRGGDETGATVRASVAAGYRAGLPIRWPDYYRGRERQRITLPSYAFDRRRYWLPAGGRAAASAEATHPLLGVEVDAPTTGGPTTGGPATGGPATGGPGVREFVQTLTPDRPGYLRDHVVLDQVVVPAACYVELLLAAQDAVFGTTGRPVRELRITEPLMLTDEAATELVTRLRPAEDGGALVEVVSRLAGQPDAIERRHATARIGPPEPPEPGEPGGPAELAGLVEDLRAAAAAGPAGEPLSVEDVYADFDELGLSYGTSFRRITALRRAGDGVAVASLRGHRTGIAEFLPPFLLDNVIQSVAAVLTGGQTYLPVRFGVVRLLGKPKSACPRSLLRVTGDGPGPDELRADLVLLDEDRPVAVVRDLGLRRVVATGEEQHRRVFHEPRWVKRSLVRRPEEGRSRDVLVVGADARTCAGLAAHAARRDLAIRCVPDAEQAAALLTERAPTDLCWFWTTRPGEGETAAALRAACERNYRDLLALLATLRSRGFGPDQRLWLVTEHAQYLAGDAPGEPPAAATLWGFGRSLASEHPGYQVTLLDLDDDGAALLEECAAAEAGESQIAYRGGRRHVLRLLPSRLAGPQQDDFELVAPDSGEFADIRRAALAASPPSGGEIQVRMRAAGLNFKDVLNALGMLREHARSAGHEYRELPLGFEGAGVVAAVGPEAEFAVGDEVVVSQLGCLRTRVTVPSQLAISKPAGLSFVDAAGLPTAYITAWYALRQLAGLKAGDRVLIHAAAGGVGQAAVAVARLAGAEIFATASPGKHEFLRAQGIRHVLNSRTLEFAEQIRARTGGAGVDVVLNSLNNDYVPAGLRALAEGGRFVELGKVGVWSAEQVRAARPDVAYFTFDLSELPEVELRETSGTILRAVAGLLADGSIAPVTTTRYGLDEVEEAFGVLSRGGNVGKLVLDLTEPDPIGSAPPLAFDPAETCLITGGLGALGMVTASRLAAGGLRRLDLLSRRAVAPDEAAAVRARLGERVEVTFRQGDVAEPADVERVLSEIAADGRRLAGIVHAAGVLADGPVAGMSWERIERVLRAKVYGTHALAQAVRGRPELKFFVGYSSMASVLGPVGQANYAAGNAFIDAVMTRRHAAGEPGLSVCWGPWAEVGMAAELTAPQIRAIEEQGLRFLSPAAGARALWRLLGQPVGQVLVGAVDWEKLVARRGAGDALLRRLARGRAAAEQSVDLPALLALPRLARQDAINEAVRVRVASLLHFESPQDIPAHARFLDLGVDSLTAVELKNALETMFRTALPTSVVFDFPTITELAAHLDAQLAPAEDAGVPDEAAALAEADLDAELAALRRL